MANDLELVVDEGNGDFVTLAVRGELDAATAPKLKSKLVELVGEVHHSIVLDLGGVDFIDSSALGVILSAWKLMRSQDGNLVIVSPHSRITRIFEITGLTLSISVQATAEQALAAVSRAAEPPATATS